VGNDSFDAYRDRLIGPHQNRVTSIVATAGDVVAIAGLLAAVVTRRLRVALLGVTAGTALAVVAHFFQPGTVRDEIREVLRHPMWAARAEGQRIVNRPA
jgi:hypothetical protein